MKHRTKLLQQSKHHFFKAPNTIKSTTFQNLIGSLLLVGLTTWHPRVVYSVVYLRSTPHPVRVTTRIITFLVGNPYKPSFPLLLGGGTTQCIPYCLTKDCQTIGSSAMKLWISLSKWWLCEQRWLVWHRHWILWRSLASRSTLDSNIWLMLKWKFRNEEVGKNSIIWVFPKIGVPPNHPF